MGLWQIGRVSKDASWENVQSLDTNIVNMTVELLNLWFTKFVQEVCKPNEDRYPPRTVYCVCGVRILNSTSWHFVGLFLFLAFFALLLRMDVL